MALGRVLPPDPSQFVQRSGDAMSGDLTFSAGATAVVPDPVDPTDAVNLRTLEAAAGSLPAPRQVGDLLYAASSGMFVAAHPVVTANGFLVVTPQGKLVVT